MRGAATHDRDDTASLKRATSALLPSSCSATSCVSSLAATQLAMDCVMNPCVVPADLITGVRGAVLRSLLVCGWPRSVRTALHKPAGAWSSARLDISSACALAHPGLLFDVEHLGDVFVLHTRHYRLKVVQVLVYLPHEALVAMQSFLYALRSCTGARGDL